MSDGTVELTETRWLDRSGWGPGPWDAEDDRVEWRDRGYPCLVLRGPPGALCGYVGVPPGHPWHGVDYGAVDDRDNVRVHGGLTYSGACAGHICHVAQPGELEPWWLGFDTNHYRDYAPLTEAKIGLMTRTTEHDGTYRTVEYLRAEVARLVDQAIAAAGGAE